MEKNKKINKFHMYNNPIFFPMVKIGRNLIFIYHHKVSISIASPVIAKMVYRKIPVRRFKIQLY